MKRPLSWLAMPLLVMTVAAMDSRVVAAAESEPSWTIRGQGQLPVISAKHAVGGFGVAVVSEKNRWAARIEAQILPIVVCDRDCGNAYAAGVGVAFQPDLGRGVSSHLELMARYYAYPALHQYVPVWGPRVGLRWPDQGTAFSLDAGVSFATARNFGPDGFAKNKVIGWGIPELMLGLWF
jgi:hypothetical protein